MYYLNLCNLLYGGEYRTQTDQARNVQDFSGYSAPFPNNKKLTFRMINTLPLRDYYLKDSGKMTPNEQLDSGSNQTE